MKILICDYGLPFDLNTPYFKPLGGSEISILLLSKGLAELGHSVVLLNTNNYTEQDKNIILNNVSHFEEYAKLSDIILLNRHIPNEIMNFLDKPIYYWSHDAYDQDNVKWMMNRNVEQNLTKILCVSNWQKQTFVNYLKVDKNKINILSNPIDHSLSYGYTERNNLNIIYAGIPYKGLEVLPSIIKDIQVSIPNASFDIFSSFEIYNQKQENKQYSEIYRQLNNISNVSVNDNISMKDLSFKFKSSGYYISPSIYHETFGRVYIEAMSNGCLPIVLNNGANKEIIKDYGYIVNYPNIKNKKAYNKYIKTICDLLVNNDYNKRLLAEKYAQSFDYIKICKKFEHILGV